MFVGLNLKALRASASTIMIDQNPTLHESLDHVMAHLALLLVRQHRIPLLVVVELVDI